MVKKRILACALGILLLLYCIVAPGAVKANAAATLTWPVPGHTGLSRGYSSGHKGIDICDANINGTTVVAAMGGTVFEKYQCTAQHYNSPCPFGGCNGFGTGLVIKGDDGRIYQYAHMQPGSIPASIYSGVYVAQGQAIGRVGTTGNSTGPHLHFAIASSFPYGKSDVNPEQETYDNGAFTQNWTWSNFSATNVTQTDARITVTARPSTPGKFTATGLRIFDHNGLQVGSKNEQGDPSARTYLTIFYDIHKELGITLMPGHTYYAEFYTTCNGQKGTSQRFSFSTLTCSAHNYGSWTTVQDANCGADGLEKRTCSACGHEDTRKIPATGNHVYTDDADTACDVCGHVRTVNKIRIYRLYNKFSSEHLYCSDPKEIRSLLRSGWSMDGCAWLAPKTGSKVYRLFNPNDGSHLYTMNSVEISNCVRAGWTVDGVVCRSADTNGIPIIRLFNPHASSHYHLYTVDPAEIRFLTGKGWQQEGIAWYAAR